MPEKRKQAVRRKLSGLLAVTMLFGAVFNHFWGRMFYATSPDVATGSDAVRNGIVSLTNLPAEDVQVIVMSDEGGYEQGGSYCVDVYIKNDTAETIEDASLNYSATSIEKESVYFEDLSVDVGTEDPITIITDTDRTEGTDEIPAPTAGQTDGSGEPTDPTAGQTGVTEAPTEAPTDPTAELIQEGEGTKPTSPAGEKAGSSAGDIVTEGADEDEDMDQGDDSDDEEEEEPWRLTELTIQPGQSYHVQFYFQVKESIKGTKSQTIEFIFRWKDGEGKHRSTKGTFHYVVGAMNLLPVEVLNPYLLETDQAKKLYAGGKGEMLIDFELGGVWEIIEEEEIKAGDVDIPEADEPVSTKSDAEKADPSDQGTASVSDAKIATPPQASTDEKLDDYTNGTIQWGEETSGKPIVEKVKCDVDTYGIRLTDFRLAPREEEDEYGTTARCTFRVSKDVKPGAYYGTVTANYTFKNKRFTSSQGFAIQVAMIDDEAVAAVVALIDDLPEMEEIEENLRAYEMAEDDEGYEEYYMNLMDQVMTAYYMYQDLTEEQQKMVYNRDKLMGFEWLWSGVTFAIVGDDDPDKVVVTAINKFDWGSRAVIAYSDGNGKSTVAEVTNTTAKYDSWSAATIKKKNGRFVVENVIASSEEPKQKYGLLVPDKAEGFLLLWHPDIEEKAKKNIKTGDVVDVPEGWDTIRASFDKNGLCTLTFSDPGLEKKQNDNSNKLEIVKSADTNEFITVNLYDYYDGEYYYNKEGGVGKEAINGHYSADKNYPGFQLPGGTVLPIDSTSNKWKSDFGDIIVADRGKRGETWFSSVTSQGGAINQSVGGNSPINHLTLPDQTGAMYPELINGYPALADGTSLDYLFSESAYASKKNSGSINGLFQYNETTGAYTFNSRENHAQYNGDDTFTLYKQIITSNFIMYPFGNFLPFNDIVHECTQASSIVADNNAGIDGKDQISGSAYFEKLAASAIYKYNNNTNASKYKDLAEVLRRWAGLMDKDKPSGWGANEAIDQYFQNVPADKMPYKVEGLMDKLYSIDYDEPTDFFFGMDMSMEFMQPKGGLTGLDGKQLTEFYFTGDDDVWVYVDGKLFLDLSGIHRHVGGKIDFVNGLVSYYDLDVAKGDVDIEGTPSHQETFAEILRRIDTTLTDQDLEEILKRDKTGQFSTFKDYSIHKFNFYYMERGSGSGVCRMNFNFPLLRDNTLSVTKKVTALDEQGNETDVNLLGNPDFLFRVLKANGANKTDELYIEEGTSYKVYDGNNNFVKDGTTEANGVFKIKAGQTAVFEVKENSGSYYVQELMDPQFLAQYKNVVVDGEVAETDLEGETIGESKFTGFESGIKDISDASSTVFSYANQVWLNRTGNLEISKALEGVPSGDVDQQKEFQFKVKLDEEPLLEGTAYKVRVIENGTEKYLEDRAAEAEGIIKLHPGETAVIEKILAGSKYTVEEVAASAAGYDISYRVNNEPVSKNPPSGLIPAGEEKLNEPSVVEIVVTNAAREIPVDIPVTKTLQNPDGKAHTYKFSLQEVDVDLEEKIVRSVVDGGVYQEIPVEIPQSAEGTTPGDITSVNGNFTLSYLEKNYLAEGTTPKRYYYKITEEEDKTDPSETKTIFDQTDYIVEVTVDQVTADGKTGLQARITNKWKLVDDKLTSFEGEGGQQITFTNIIGGTELPETGGPGTFWYTFSGVAMMAIALMYDTFRRRKRRPVRS